MNLVERLAELTALRDRDELDVHLMHTVRGLLAPDAVQVALACLVEYDGQEHWFRYAQLAADAARPVLHSELPDISHMPPRQAQPLWHLACENGQAAVGHDDSLPTLPQQCVIPIHGAHQPCRMVMALHTAQSIEPEKLSNCHHLARIHANLIDFLDYGEKDTLTDLLNRKTFDTAFLKAVMSQSASHEFAEPERRQTSPSDYWLAVMDIDHFKRVNDTYGHTIGDEVLLLMSRLMRRSFRLQDKLYRFGGEEFVVLLRCTSEQDTQHVLDRFRLAVQAHTFPQVGQITVSMGFSKVRPMDMPGDAFERADQAVYFAKSHGRNQVRHFEALVESQQIAESTADTGDVDLF